MRNSIQFFFRTSQAFPEVDGSSPAAQPAIHLKNNLFRLRSWKGLGVVLSIIYGHFPHFRCSCDAGYPHGKVGILWRKTRSPVQLMQHIHSINELKMVASTVGLRLSLGALNYPFTPFGNAVEVMRISCASENGTRRRSHPRQGKAVATVE